MKLPMVAKSHLDAITQRNVAMIAKLEAVAEGKRRYYDRLADWLVKWVGSWTFLVTQSVGLVVWMLANVVEGIEHWDPYPFVLLNLVLSFQAAFAMPLILMCENRQSRIAERRSHLDLQINLLSEQENTEQLRLLRLLCEKMGIGTTSEEQAMEEATKPSNLVRQIVEIVERERRP